ncbi:T9SS type A sorting domain-containing protein [bacterium]|nr:T9SS type A sorting domain-containing protein [bacterium]
MQWIRTTARLSLAVPFLLCAAVLLPASTAGAFGYTLEQIDPYQQMSPQWFTPPYYHLLLTNDAATADDFHLEIQNLTQPTWFPTVCLRSTCFPDSTTLNFAPGATDTIGVQVGADFTTQDEFGEWDFILTSVGDPQLSTTIHMEMYSGASANGVPQLVISMDGHELRQNLPNPVHSSTAISFVLPREEAVELGVFDVAGRLVSRLENGVFPAGMHTATWNGFAGSGAKAPAGVYFYRLQTPAGELTKKMTLVR